MPTLHTFTRILEAQSSSGSGYHPGEDHYLALEHLRTQNARMEAYLLGELFALAYGYRPHSLDSLTTFLRSLGHTHPLKDMEAWRALEGLHTDQELADRSS